MLTQLLLSKNIIHLHPSDEDSMLKALDFVENALTNAEVPMKIIMKMNIAVDEIFSNIKLYSGAEQAEIACDVQNDGTIVLIFVDNGKPYNPLLAEEPDTTLDAEDRQIGGLGIFMVKKTMDDITYEYQDNQNILTLYKKNI